MPVTRSLHFTNEVRSVKDLKETCLGGSSGKSSVCMMFASLPLWGRPSLTLNIGCVCTCVLTALFCASRAAADDIDANVHISSCFDIGKPSLPPASSPGGPTVIFSQSAETLAGARSRCSTVATVAVCCDSVRLIMAKCAYVPEPKCTAES